jgi:ubiquinone/menaquinone biosynthesis C-methylase UbiE
MSETIDPTVTPERILQMAWGYAPPLILEAAIKNRVFDILDSGPLTAEQVSEQTGSSVRGLTMIMNVLVGLNFLAKNNENVYYLTPESSAFLVSTKPSFQGGILRHTSEQLIPQWLNLNEVVRTGKPSVAVNEKSTGASFFVELVKDIFPMSYKAASALGDAMGFSKCTEPVSVLDVAAGSGVWGIALAQKSPNVSVSALDWPEVLEVTKQFTERFGLTSRFSYIPGDLMEAEFGTGYTIATLGHILHSEGEERSRKLLQMVYTVLKHGGTIAIAEFTPDEGRSSPLQPLIFAVNMLVNTDYGDTYTFAEVSSWLSDTGFTHIHQLPAPGPSPLILAEKP